MVRSHSFAWILVSLLSLTLAAPLQADITPSGDVDPTIPDNLGWWTSGGFINTYAYIGKTAAGSVTVNLGSDLSSGRGYIGCSSGSTGVVTVDGNGSTWTNSSYLYVGASGHGTLNITNGGAVAVGYYWTGYIGYSSGSTGEVTVAGSGSTWTNNWDLCVGHSGQGTLNITNGGAVSNYGIGYIGYKPGSTGVVTVDGSGSTWTNSNNLDVGSEGQGTLNITNGGSVNVTGDTWVERYDGAAGEIHFDGGTLTTGYLLAGATDLTGTGTINTHGLLSDVDLLFDSTHGLNQTLMLNSQPGQNITINLTQDSTGVLGSGYVGNGTMSIRDGVSVESKKGYIGYKAGAIGVVTVAGSGSTWTCYGPYSDLYVGEDGHGTLNITNGGAVSNSKGHIAGGSGSTGMVTVNGSGSTWTNSLYLNVGDVGQGTLNITNGGTVSNTDGYIGDWLGSTGEVTVDGGDSTWTSSGRLTVGRDGHGTLNITNGGAVSNNYGLIGDWFGSTGEVTVDGSGST